MEQAGDTENVGEPMATEEPEAVSGEPNGSGTHTAMQAAQVEKLVAGDEAAVQSLASGKNVVDLQSLPTRQYLDQTVVPILLQAMAETARERPPNPVEYLAAFLLKNKDMVEQFSSATETASTATKSLASPAPTPKPT
eukprot:scpid105038/ scgid20808/ Protein dpy-30 homolog; Dpy-30-like protein